MRTVLHHRRTASQGHGGDPVISLDGLFKADFGGLGSIGGGTINPSLSKWSEYKAFPNNIEARSLLTFRGEREKRRKEA